MFSRADDVIRVWINIKDDIIAKMEEHRDLVAQCDRKEPTLMQSEAKNAGQSDLAEQVYC